MKVLQVYKDIFPEVRGGIERYVRDLSLHLQSCGHSVEILVAGGGHRSVDRLKVSGIWSPFRILSNPVAPGYTGFLAGTDADVIHFHLPLPAAVMAWCFVKDNKRKPYVVTYHSDIVRQSFFMPVYGPFLRRFLEGAAKVIATSDNYLSSSSYLRGLHNSEVIPIGVDLTKFTPAPDAVRNYYLFVGRFRRYKGIFVLLDAWRKMSDPPNLILAGGGKLVGKIREFVKKHDLPVVLAIDVSDHELLKLYQRAKALILPSTRRSEAYGMVQVEAMACNTAVISSDLSTGVSWVNKHNETGFLFTTGHSQSLCDAVTRFDMSVEIRIRMCRNAGERARNVFDSSNLFRKVEECLIKATEI